MFSAVTVSPGFFVIIFFDSVRAGLGAFLFQTDPFFDIYTGSLSSVGLFSSVSA